MLALLDAPSALERGLSYIYGFLLLFLFLFSSFLNPLILYCFKQRKPSLINSLYKRVAVLDFLANLPSLPVAVISLSPSRQGVFWPSSLGLLACLFGCEAQACTSLLAVTRLILLLQPFYLLSRPLIRLLLLLYLLLKTVLSLAAWFLLREIEYSSLGPDSRLTYIHDILVTVCFSLNFLSCLVGVACSLAAYCKLRFREEAVMLRSSGTVLLMNIPYIVSIACNVAAVRLQFQYGFYYASFIMLHVVISAYNPCVILARTAHVRETLRGLVGMWRGRIQGAVQHGGERWRGRIQGAVQDGGERWRGRIQGAVREGGERGQLHAVIQGTGL